MRYQASFPRRTLAYALVLTMLCAGCGEVIDRLTGVYRGPQPSRDELRAETVVVRRVGSAEGKIGRLLLDRARYLESGNAHDVNRVVEAYTGQVQAQIDALKPQVGDRFVVSTQFVAIEEIGDVPTVPNWPGHDYAEFPIGLHSLTSIARANP